MIGKVELIFPVVYQKTEGLCACHGDGYGQRFPGGVEVFSQEFFAIHLDNKSHRTLSTRRVINSHRGGKVAVLVVERIIENGS